jgi:hypothetical protein
MSNGLRKTWLRGERNVVPVRDSKGNDVPLLGKNGGPVIKQEITLVMGPR